MRQIESLVGAAEGEHPKEKLKKLLRALVPDFHPHRAPVVPVADEELRIAAKELRIYRP
jgi:hypothetical protein